MSHSIIRSPEETAETWTRRYALEEALAYHNKRRALRALVFDARCRLVKAQTLAGKIKAWLDAPI